MTVNKNDPRLTAFIRGERDVKDQLEIEAAV